MLAAAKLGGGAVESQQDTSADADSSEMVMCTSCGTTSTCGNWCRGVNGKRICHPCRQRLKIYGLSCKSCSYVLRKSEQRMLTCPKCAADPLQLHKTPAALEKEQTAVAETALRPHKGQAPAARTEAAANSGSTSLEVHGTATQEKATHSVRTEQDSSSEMELAAASSNEDTAALSSSNDAGDDGEHRVVDDGARNAQAEKADSLESMRTPQSTAESAATQMANSTATHVEFTEVSSHASADDSNSDDEYVRSNEATSTPYMGWLRVQVSPQLRQSLLAEALKEADEAKPINALHLISAAAANLVSDLAEAQPLALPTIRDIALAGEVIEAAEQRRRRQQQPQPQPQPHQPHQQWSKEAGQAQAITPIKSCESCAATKSPRWHNWLSGPSVTPPRCQGFKLCNACNSRWKLNTVLCQKCHYIPRVKEFTLSPLCPRCSAENTFIRKSGDDSEPEAIAPARTFPTAPQISSRSLSSQSHHADPSKSASLCASCSSTSPKGGNWLRGYAGVRLCNACGRCWHKYGVTCHTCHHVLRKNEHNLPTCPQCNSTEIVAEFRAKYQAPARHLDSFMRLQAHALNEGSGRPPSEPDPSDTSPASSEPDGSLSIAAALKSEAHQFVPPVGTSSALDAMAAMAEACSRLQD